ncbi:hypothetical protein C487_12261 [Natrinema pallidum DSM 3751]|uniref:Archaeal Type IV pilin N-terminal domain-containing protein n=1 Tax=Natrinema pallidum DSM 3751 TaxID=1227495 RepID=L9YRY8_9EURY|nr:hypothetical protein C487_12261 [Natrinema pallidum DSM 3751]
MILMVAITVILAAVIAAFVLDLGGSVGQEAQAGVGLEVDEEQQEIKVEVTSLGNADHVNLSGDIGPSEIDDTNAYAGTQTANDIYKGNMTRMGVGDTVTIGDVDNGADVHLTAAKNDNAISGTVTAVAVIEEDGTETQVGSEDFNFDYS